MLKQVGGFGRRTERGHPRVSDFLERVWRADHLEHGCGFPYCPAQSEIPIPPKKAAASKILLYYIPFVGALSPVTAAGDARRVESLWFYACRLAVRAARVSRSSRFAWPKASRLSISSPAASLPWPLVVSLEWFLKIDPSKRVFRSRADLQPLKELRTEVNLAPVAGEADHSSGVQ